jgi:bifunctional non-homologous end joining protein LigD
MPRAASPLEPQLATLVDEAPAGDGWLHEMKLDGYRLVAEVDKQHVALRTRNGNDWAARVPGVVAALRTLREKSGEPSLVLDGELVVMNERGASDFQRLQNALAAGSKDRPVFYVFDLLRRGRRELAPLPLDQRKQELAEVLAAAKSPRDGVIRLSAHVVGDGAKVFAEACRLELEGIISKRRDAPYRPGRSADWLKVKCKRQQEFVVGGFTAPRASRSHFGALLIGLHDAQGKLRYAGKVGTGFSSASLAEIHARLEPLVQERPAFVDPPRGAEARDVKWIAPRLLAQIEFAEMTAGGRVRHPSFQGLRDDKAARGVGLEKPAPTAAATSATPAASRSSRAARAPRSASPGGGRTRRAPSARDRGPGRSR